MFVKNHAKLIVSNKDEVLADSKYWIKEGMILKQEINAPINEVMIKDLVFSFIFSSFLL